MLLPKPIKPGRAEKKDSYPRPSDAIAGGGEDGGASASPCLQVQEFKHQKGFPEVSGTLGAGGVAPVWGVSGCSNTRQRSVFPSQMGGWVDGRMDGPFLVCSHKNLVQSVVGISFIHM